MENAMLIWRDKNLRVTIWKIAWPAMGEMILYMLVGVVDVAVVGRLGAVPLAAASLGAEIFFSLVLFLNALGIGTSILVAQAKGANRLDEAALVAGQSLLMALFIGLTAAVLTQVYLLQILALFRVEAAVSQQALAYLRITLALVPPALIYYIISSIFRGLGRTDIPMKIGIITNSFNVVGDLVLVFGWFGFPAMGVAGAAVATSIAHFLGFILSLWALMSNCTELTVPWRSIFALRLNIIRRVLSLGIPGLVEQLFTTAAQLTSTYLLVFLGTVAYASHQVAIVVESISFMPGFGLAIAATTLVGQAVGASDRNKISQNSRGCLEMAGILMGFIGVLFALFPYFIASLFTDEPDIIRTAGLLVRIASLEQLTIAATMVLSGILKGSGDTRTPMYISTVFTWLVRIPLMYLFIMVLHWPVASIWVLFVIDWGLRGVVYAIIYRRKKWLEKAILAQSAK
jgi:putative MATE family efflux protein